MLDAGATVNISTLAIAAAVTSNEKIGVWLVSSPVVTVFKVLEVVWYSRDFLTVDLINNCHRSRPSFFSCFVPLFLQLFSCPEAIGNEWKAGFLLE